jgi:hypothetical protein
MVISLFERWPSGGSGDQIASWFWYLQTTFGADNDNIFL